MSQSETERDRNELLAGNTFLGIEFGSTRIKAVLVSSAYKVIASGSYDWENSLCDGIWTYPLEQVHAGLRGAYASLKKQVAELYGVTPCRFAAMGVSAMMHGYLAFDDSHTLLVPFRTWRNTMTAQASEELSREFGVPVPERWSIAHLYQAILNGEEHVARIRSMTTLAGYVHFLLTGRNVLGIGDASGMFPVDYEKKSYDENLMRRFDALAASHSFARPIHGLLPDILLAGETAGTLTQEGSLLLDPDGDVQPGIPLCPPEGDAGTGMTATDSVLPRSGNVSAGTSVFAMVVLEKPLSKAYTNKIDVVATPDGRCVAMAHANNCTGEYDRWIALFGEVASLLGARFSKDELYQKLLGAALDGDKDCGGILSYNYLSGESMTGFASGRPLVVRGQDCALTLGNFMRSQLFASLCALRTGMDILSDGEHVPLERLTGHGGFFKCGQVGQTVMSSALRVPVTVLSTAGEGGPWGMALLAAYMHARVCGTADPLSVWLERCVFASAERNTVSPSAEDCAGFDSFYKKHCAARAVEQAAVESVQ